MEQSQEEEEIEMSRRVKFIVLGQRAEPSTPTTSWKIHFHGDEDFFHSSVSARKLCANLWEFLPQIRNPQPISTKKKKKKKKAFELQTQPANASSSRIQASKSVDRNASHSHIKDLLKEKEITQREMHILQKITEDKLSRNHKMQDQNEVKGLIRSTQAKLEGERKLQKHYESLHLKLARELLTVKSAFSNALKELERERKARVLLENLCDEFAKGIRDYEQEVQSIRHKPGMDPVDGSKPDLLIQHISKAWLEKRDTGKNTVNENLSLDIESFLRARRSNTKKNRTFPKEAMNGYSRRESFPISAHQDAPDREDSVDSDHLYPMQKLKGKLTSPETGKPKSFLQLPSGVKENTLKAKLLEARLESRKNRAVMRILEPNK